MDVLDDLIPTSDHIFKHPFPSLEIPEFYHFPIEDGNFGDLEFLDLASDRLLCKSKNPAQFSDIYFNSLATPSGYCSANYLTEEANRLSLLLSESGEREKGDVLDRSLIENLEELFGVGNQTSKPNVTIDEQLPNVLGTMDHKSSYEVEFEVTSDVLNIMAKNFENLEDLIDKSHNIPSQIPDDNVDKTITIKSVCLHSSPEPPAGAVAKIILISSKSLNMTKITFSSMDDTEQHSFCIHTANMRKAGETLRSYHPDNLQVLRRLLKLPASGLPRSEKLPDTRRDLEDISNPSFAQTSSLSYPVQCKPVPWQQTEDKGSCDKLGSGKSNPLSGELRKENSVLIHSSDMQLKLDLENMGIDLEIKKIKVGKETYLCCSYQDCTKAYSSGYELKLHIMTHFNIKPFKCDHSGCSWKFVTAFKLQRHKKSHEKQKEFKCTYNQCDKMFSTQYNLTVHIKNHGKLQDFVCSQCSQVFTGKKLLEEHSSRFHPLVSKPFSCKFPGCDKSYFNKSHLQSHSRFHNSPSYICQAENCGKKYSTIHHLRNHELTHSEKQRYTCQEESCSHSFKSLSKLQRHRKTHEDLAFVCNVCQKSFYRSDHHRSHTLTHNLEKPFQCLADFCEKKFAGRILLLDHVRKVHRKKNERTSSLLCPMSDCSRRFVSRMSFETHLAEHGKGLQEGNLSEPPESSSHLDFVSLLSSVGEDILFPDELSCPEYEISSDLVEKRHIQSSDLPVLLHSQQVASKDHIGNKKSIPTELSGSEEIFITIQSQDNTNFDHGHENVLTVIQSENGLYSLPNLANLSNLTNQQESQYLVEAMNGEVEILIDEPIIFERNGQILEPEEELELPSIQASSPAREGFETNLENFAEEVTFLEANKQSNLCVTQAESNDEVYLAPLVKHSTINLQDLN